MMRMLIVGYCFGIRSEHRLWLVLSIGLDADVPDHSTFSKNRRGRFRESDLLRKLFETVIARCTKEGIVGGEAFAVDASMIVADAHRRRSVAKVEDLDPTCSRAVAEYLSVLDDAAFGGATPVEPKAISPTDHGGPLCRRDVEVAKTRVHERVGPGRPPMWLTAADTQGIDKRPVSAVMMLDWLSTFRANTTARTCL
jgi:hypothetical protein